MRAVQIDRFGGPEVLVVREIAEPEPKAGEVRVRTSVIGVNFTDVSVREGLYPVPLPSGIGMDAVGVIDAVGAGVTDWRPGDRVAFSAGPPGAYAEACCINADRVLAAPADIPEDVLASALMKGLTARYLLKETFPVRPGHKVLIHSAAGGVGSIATQWARGLGATVVGAVGSDDKIPVARANGCAEVVNSRSPDWAAQVRQYFGGAGADVVYDCVGHDTFDGSVACLAPRGTFVSFGMQSGPPPLIDLAMMRAKGSLAFVAPSGAHYATTRETLVEAYDDVINAIRSGMVRLVVGHTYRLDQASEAHAALQARATCGPVVLIP